ncbi:MAG: hypothetical protein FD167_848 [bacterium]|nr:MAG: hypothetical protein FD167_848 [bacterium]
MAKKKASSNKLNEVKLFGLDQEEIGFASMCKFIRKTLVATQQELAEKLQVSNRTYRDWEYGKYVPKSWQALNLGLLYLYAKELEAKQQSSENTSQDSQQHAA